MSSDLEEQDAERAQIADDHGYWTRLYGGRRPDAPAWHPDWCDCHACWQPPERIDRMDATIDLHNTPGSHH